MSKILVGIFTVGLCFTLGYTLECYKCDLGFWGLCITTKETCPANELCFYGKGKTAGVIKLQMKGCLDVKDCNKTTDVTFPTESNTTIYKMTKTCCNTDLCNTATPLAYTHTLLLASLAALLLTKVLV
ncbi:cytotoxin 5b [Neoarius graeffei]|uniref:cytotoxin 5b n=1 Tax=Neoarius graeffei TaxID=443677 RepID=UPI00298C322F|nr:cytotoxin 5b [Neoarius graeffei]